MALPKLVDEKELLLYNETMVDLPSSFDELGRDVVENNGFGHLPLQPAAEDQGRRSLFSSTWWRC